MTDKPTEDIPERRKNDKLLEQKLNEKVGSIEQQLRRWLMIGIGCMAIIGITSAIALIGYGVVINEIQASRRSNCEDVNRRHDKTINTIRLVSAQGVEKAKTKQDLEEVIRGRDYTLLLVEQLTPKRDCYKFAPDKSWFPL